MVLLFVAGLAAAGDYAVDRGVLSLGGDLYFEKGFGSGYDFTSTTVSPGIHYFLFRRLSLGVDLNLELRNQGPEEFRNLSGYIMAGYHLGRRSGSIFPFFSAGVGGGKWDSGVAAYDFFGIRAQAGVIFMFNQYIGLRTVASYTLDMVKPDGSTAQLDGGRIRIGAGVVLHLY
jgi:hypothetical protein